MSEDAEKKIVSGIEDENKRIREAAEKAREDAGHDEGETEEEYRERIANVPGIFGDTDTTAGVGASQTEVVSSDNEQATVAAAAVEADEGHDDVSHDEARRQADVAGPAPSAQEVDAAVEGDDSDKDSDEGDKKSSSRRSKK